MASLAPAQQASTESGRGRSRLARRIGWQGFALRTPDDWDLTGYSGSATEGYFRADDSESLGIEVKWATESKRSRKEPDLDDRRSAFILALRKTARKKRVDFEVKKGDADRGVLRSDREALGFQWTGDRKAYGALWYCRTCRRVVIAQVLGELSGRKGLASVAASTLASLTCHGDDPAWNRWTLYDLDVEVPTDYQLASAQLMNVYLRLAFAKGTARLSIEQWAAASVARGDVYLDMWLAANAKGEMAKARYQVDEASVSEHEAVRCDGGLAFGTPMWEAVREATSLRWPATRFSALGWECGQSNKIYAVESLRPRREADPVAAVAQRLRCHGGEAQE